MAAKKPMAKGKKNGSKITVTVQMAKKKESAAEKRREMKEDRMEMQMKKKTIAALNKIAKKK